MTDPTDFSISLGTHIALRVDFQRRAARFFRYDPRRSDDREEYRRGCEALESLRQEAQALDPTGALWRSVSA